MALGDRIKGLWDRATGKESQDRAPQDRRPEQAARPPQPKNDPARDEAILRRDRRINGGPADRFIPSHKEEMKDRAQRVDSPKPEKPRQVEPSKMANTRTAQPAPTPGGMANTIYTNRTSNFKASQEPQTKAPAQAKAPEQSAAAKPVQMTPASNAWREQFQRKDQAADRAQRQADKGPSPLDQFRRTIEQDRSDRSR